MSTIIVARGRIGAALLMIALAPSALAYTVTIAAGASKGVYLQIGVGTLTGASNYGNGGTPGNLATVNKESVTVAAAAVGNNTAQAMTTDSAVAQSSYDGYTYCTAGTQLYIGSFYRNPAATGAAILTATVPATLTNATGNTIPFSQISWTSAGNGDTAGNGFLPEVFPGGTFVNGGVQNLGSVPLNKWAESCWTFSYANSLVPAVGTYTGRVLYTLTTP